MAEVSMPMPQKCQNCKLRSPGSFCTLPREVLIELDRIKRVRQFSPGERLFEEGKLVDELMIVCEGTAVLTFESSVGNESMLGLSKQGEVLGLSSAISGHPHENSAEALENTRIATVSCTEFLSFLQHFPEAAMNAGTELSRKVNRAYDKIRLIGSGLSVHQRLAAWLLQLKDSQPDSAGPITIAMTHERIAQLLGVSRESVTRAFSSLKKAGVLKVRGIHFYVRDYKYLRSLLHVPE